jgi:signal transduction histidine kinase/CheY-like chemotaxis protein
LAKDLVTTPRKPGTPEARRVTAQLRSIRALRRELRRQAEAARQSEQRLQQALEEVERGKEQFLAMLAHELRNPLAPIRNALEILREGDVDDETSARLKATMDRQLGHLVRLVDDLLDLSHISDGQVTLHPERVSLASILGRAVELGRPSIDAAGHTLSIRAADEPVWIQGDLTRLAQVVGHLLDNAAKLTSKGGRVELAAFVEGGQLVVRVADDGIGIDADMLPRVFEPLALERAQGGIGIGLCLARLLVEMHGGTLVGESLGAGRGSTFTVRLPLAVAATAGEHASKPSEQPPVPSSRRILVVDDNVEAAEMLAMLLERSGHAVTMAHDGPQAIEAVRAEHPEVVFLDIGMPEMDGYEVAKRLRADPSTADTTIVALTGWGSESDRRASKEAGFDAHLVKPVGRETLAEVLTRSWRPSADPG